MGTKTAKYEGIALRPTKTKEYYMVGQSQSSAYAGAPGCSTSGIGSLEKAIEDLCEGGYAIDKRHLSWEVACCVISGPMEHVGLPPLTMRNGWEPQRTFASFEEFFSYLEKETPPLTMTYLSMDLYAEWWRRKGAKVGRKVKGTIQWKPAYSGPLFERETSNVG